MINKNLCSIYIYDNDRAGLLSARQRVLMLKSRGERGIKWKGMNTIGISRFKIKPHAKRLGYLVFTGRVL